MKKGENLEKEEIELNLNVVDVNKVEVYIEDLIKGADFYSLNTSLKDKDDDNQCNQIIDNASFISLADDVKTIDINEEEFMKIVGAKNGKISSHCGNYQKSLYSHYKYAKKICDEGYLSDVYRKALELKREITATKKLMKNQKFMKTWKQNVGRISPLTEIKRTGEMIKINLVKGLI